MDMDGQKLSKKVQVLKGKLHEVGKGVHHANAPVAPMDAAVGTAASTCILGLSLNKNVLESCKIYAKVSMFRHYGRCHSVGK